MNTDIVKHRYFISFAYDGTHYHGWQIQPNGHSVQAELQQALSLLLRTPIHVVGAGRTDTGVHARMMIAHFDFEGKLPMTVEQLQYKLNRILPPDMSTYKVYEVSLDDHARFTAKSRTYHYYVHNIKDPFCRSYSYAFHFHLDFEKMNQAATYLLEVDDFGAFCKSNSDAKTTLCKVTEARWIQIDNSHWYFVITANRFLRNMVRAVVGTLVDVGKGKITIDEFKKIVDGKKRTAAGESMPACALFLENIVY